MVNFKDGVATVSQNAGSILEEIQSRYKLPRLERKTFFHLFWLRKKDGRPLGRNPKERGV